MRVIRLTTEEAERFWSYVDVRADDECHPWLAGANRSYGIFTASGRSLRAHRVAFALGTGVAVPDGVIVRHVRCHNPPCCNWRHLELGSVVDNNADRVAQKRSATGTRNGASKLRPAEVEVIRVRARSESSCAVIASDYGVSANTVRQIRDGKTWRWLDDDTREDLEVADPVVVAREMVGE